MLKVNRNKFLHHVSISAGCLWFWDTKRHVYSDVATQHYSGTQSVEKRAGSAGSTSTELALAPARNQHLVRGGGKGVLVPLKSLNR